MNHQKCLWKVHVMSTSYRCQWVKWQVVHMGEKNPRQRRYAIIMRWPENEHRLILHGLKCLLNTNIYVCILCHFLIFRIDTTNNAQVHDHHQQRQWYTIILPQQRQYAPSQQRPWRVCLKQIILWPWPTSLLYNGYSGSRNIPRRAKTGTMIKLVLCQRAINR